MLQLGHHLRRGLAMRARRKQEFDGDDFAFVLADLFRGSAGLGEAQLAGGARNCGLSGYCGKRQQGQEQGGQRKRRKAEIDQALESFRGSG